MQDNDGVKGGIPKTVDPLKLVADLTAVLVAELGLAGQLPHSGEHGRAVEVGLREFLNRTLPERFAAVSGFTLGTGGTISDQSDVLLIDTHACSRLLRFQDVGLFPVDGVIARIEVTAELDSGKFREDFDSLLAFRRTGRLLDVEGRGSPLAYLFGRDGPADATTAVNWFHEAFKKAPAEDRRFFPNALIIPLCTVVFFAKQIKSDLAPWPDPEDATHLGWIDGRTGPDVSLGWWLDLLLSQTQVLLDRRYLAQRVLSSPPTPGTMLKDDAAPPFVPTLLHYFDTGSLAALMMKFIPL